MTDRITTQYLAEAEVQKFRDDLGPFVVAAHDTQMPMVFTDANTSGDPIIFANDSFLGLTQYTRDEVLGQQFNFLMARATDKRALGLIEAEFASRVHTGSEICYRRKDGKEFWASIFISAVRAENGEIIQHFASFTDLTEHKNDIERCRMLIDELNHRVKNTLTTVQSMVSQTFRTKTDIATVQQAIQARLFALSKSHDLLTREDWKSAAIHDVIGAALETFRMAGTVDEQLVIIGPNIRFPPNEALALGIIFHELATNAIKYGALSSNDGSVIVEWTLVPAPQGDRLLLSWQEKNGPQVMEPTHRGFGVGAIHRVVAHSLSGSVNLEYEPSGLVGTIEIPVPTCVE